MPVLFCFFVHRILNCKTVTAISDHDEECLDLNFGHYFLNFGQNSKNSGQNLKQRMAVQMSKQELYEFNGDNRTGVHRQEPEEEE